MKEITITKEKFAEIAAKVTTEMGIGGMLSIPVISKIASKLFDEEKETQQPLKELEELEELKDGFKPHLRRENDFLGFIGEPTPLTALNNEPLFVGDVVETYSSDPEMNWGKKYVCKDKLGYFVMGIQMSTLNKLENGTTSNWKITKVKSYEDLAHNEKYKNVTAILEQN